MSCFQNLKRVTDLPKMLLKSDDTKHQVTKTNTDYEFKKMALCFLIFTCKEVI